MTTTSLASKANEPEPVALIDLDGTLADYDLAMRTALCRLQSPSDPPLEDDFHEGPEWLQERQRLIKQSPGFWRTLPTISRGFQVIDVLRTLNFRLMVLSKGPAKTTSAWSEKVMWCQENLPDAQITITQDKGLTYGRVLFDDWPPYITRWLEWRPRGRVVMLDHPHNRGFFHPRVFRYFGTDAQPEAEKNTLTRILQEIKDLTPISRPAPPMMDNPASS